MTNEIWKNVIGYEGLYLVSNYGNVCRICKNNNIKPIVQNTFKTGYKYVSLCKDGICKKYLVHRIVATAHIKNHNNYPCINHKDETRTNNNVDNLEWCTHKYNSNYGTNTQRAKANYNRDIVWTKHSKSVNQYDLDMNYIKTWERVSEIAKHYQVARNNIYCAITGVQNSACGFIWKYSLGNEVYLPWAD